MKPDLELLRAKVFFNLKNLSKPDDTLDPRLLEIIICECFGAKHVGDANYYADGINGKTQLSIKTRAMQPDILKKSENSRDFQSHPSRFLGMRVNQKRARYTAGVEIVQRRQALDFNDETAKAKDVGLATLQGFDSVINESYAVYGTNKTLEVIAVHGHGRTERAYLVSLFWKEYQPPGSNEVEWAREISSVIGNVSINGQSVKVFERINGNSKREATCFKEFKDLTKYQHSSHVQVPIPEPLAFDQITLLEEIKYLEQNEKNLRDRSNLSISGQLS